MSRSEVKICPVLFGRIADDSKDEKYPLSFIAADLRFFERGPAAEEAAV